MSSHGTSPRRPPPSSQKAGPEGLATESAHPARFSPDDKCSRERVTTKRRFGGLAGLGREPNGVSASSHAPPRGEPSVEPSEADDTL